MIAANKIHAKAFKAKLRAAVSELRSLLDKSGLGARQQEYLYRRMGEYKHGAGGCGALGMEQENPVNSSENLWCPKDTGAELKSRDESIRALQTTVRALQERQRTLEDSQAKRVCISEQSVADKEILAELSAENLQLKKQCDRQRQEAADLRLEHQNRAGRYKDKIERLEKSLRESVRPAAEAPAALDIAATAGAVHEAQLEVSKYRERFLTMTADLAVADKTTRDAMKMVRMLEDQIKEKDSLLRAKSHISAAPADGVEAILTEELRSVAEAFERSVRTNQELETQISGLQKRQQTMFADNAQLQNKLKLLDDDRAFIEREKRRFDGCREELSEMSGALAERERALATAQAEQDTRTQRHRAALAEAEHKLAALGGELQNAKAAHRASLAELERVQAKLALSEQNNMKYEKTVGTYKSICQRDGLASALENIEMYQRALRCSLCNTNIKNCTIVKCMHCFCMDCVTSQFKSRHRRCPTCDVDFAMSDVKKLYLNTSSTGQV
ncbi:hypothetical protein PAPHI01_1981 [Pancytospora philotis]|nr:hypothetical protein PAPHI01_1981 [Pancytospora philotis]